VIPACLLPALRVRAKAFRHSQQAFPFALGLCSQGETGGDPQWCAKCRLLFGGPRSTSRCRRAPSYQQATQATAAPARPTPNAKSTSAAANIVEEHITVYVNGNSNGNGNGNGLAKPGLSPSQPLAAQKQPAQQGQQAAELRRDSPLQSQQQAAPAATAAASAAEEAAEPQEPFSLVKSEALAGGVLDVVRLEGDRMLRIWMPPGELGCLLQCLAWMRACPRLGVLHRFVDNNWRPDVCLNPWLLASR
jgi:hypothetical protein